MAVLNYLKLDGTTQSVFQLAAATATGVKLKDNAGALVIRNAGDLADSSIQASVFNASGDVGLVINSDSTGSGGDWKISIGRPTTGMTGDWTLTLPPNAGSVGQVLTTDGTGKTTWGSAGGGGTGNVTTTVTPLNFGDTSPVAVGNLPAGATVKDVQFVVDNAWDDTPSLSVGVAGNASKYMGAGDNNLTIAGGWAVSPNLPADAAAETLQMAYSAGSSTKGSGRLLITYSV